MTITPFLVVKLRGKKDAILARQRARRVASLLNFDIHEQACIAAGTFVIACQALAQFGKATIVFQIENQQLQVFAEGRSQDTAPRFADVLEPTSLFRLTKPLPVRELAAEESELGWLTEQVGTAAHEGAFDEIVKQNQEILALLHELRLYQLNSMPKEGKSPKGHAA